MHILVISANPLFGEVIVETLSTFPGVDLDVIESQVAQEKISECQPEAVIIDDDIEPKDLEAILAATRNYPKSRIILMNTVSNNIVVQDSCRSRIKEVNDLANAIGILRNY